MKMLPGASRQSDLQRGKKYVKGALPALFREIESNALKFWDQINSLRIDAEGDSVGGHTTLMGSLELRFDLGWNFEFVSSCDTGTIREAHTRIVREGETSSLPLQSPPVRYAFIPAASPVFYT